MLSSRHLALTTFLLLTAPAASFAQQPAGPWNNRQCAVVLTYDDAIDADLDNAIPALDSVKLRGTFYLIGAAPAVARRLPEWRRAAQRGHELGNHALFHPCDGSLPDRAWVNPDHDLSKYTVGRAVDEIRATNILLTALDGKTARTFAFPCDEQKIGGVAFYDELKADFVAARSASPGLQTAAQVNLAAVNSYVINGQSGEYLIELVQQAQQSHTLLVFLFHGVGGGHPINVDLRAHRQLLRYLRAHEKDIWVAPLVEVAEKIRAYQPPAAPRK